MSSETDCCKVGDAIDKHDLSERVAGDSVDDLLRQRYLGVNNAPQTSIRSLKNWLNKQILIAVVSPHGRKTIQTRIDSDYEALVGDDADRRQLVIDDLESDGIDTAELQDDFVSTATMYRHLTNCLNASREESNTSTNWEAEKVDFTIANARNNIENILQSWDSKGTVPQASQANVSVKIYVECPECGKQTDIRYLEDRKVICEDHLTSSPS